MVTIYTVIKPQLHLLRLSDSLIFPYAMIKI